MSSVCSSSMKNRDFYCSAAAASPSSKEADKIFDKAKTILNEVDANAIKVLLHNGEELYVLPSYSVNERALRRHLNHIHYSLGGGLRCNRCYDTLMKKLVGLGYVDKYGNHRLLFDDNELHPAYKKFSSPEIVNKNNLQGFKIVTGEPFGIEFEGGFEHFSFTPLVKSTLKKFSEKKLKWYIHQKFKPLLDLINGQANEGIIESLKLILSLLPNIPHANNIIPATEWFLRVMEKRMLLRSNQDFQIKELVLHAMFDMPLHVGILSSEPVIGTWMGQVRGNLLTALEKADSVKQMRALLTERFAPTKYKRRKTPATDYQRGLAMKMMEGKEIISSLMPLENVEKYSSETHKLLTRKVSAPMSAHDIWSLERKNKRGAAGFAARANPKAAHPKTFNQLFKQITGGLQVCVTHQMQACFATEVPPSAEDVFIYPHLHSYLRDFNLNKLNISYGKWIDVEAILLMGPTKNPNNILLCLKGAKPPPNLKNNFYPGFLTTPYQRICGRAFEDLNKYNLNIPPNDTNKWAIGIGATAAFNKKGSTHTFKFRLCNNKKEEFEIGEF